MGLDRGKPKPSTPISCAKTEKHCNGILREIFWVDCGMLAISALFLQPIKSHHTISHTHSKPPWDCPARLARVQTASCP